MKMCLIRCLTLNEHLYLSGELLGVDLRTDTERHVFQRDELRAQILITILDIIMNIIGGGGTCMIK